MSRFGRDSVKGFLKVQGRKIVNEAGEEVILESFGVANWQNPEGFLCGSPFFIMDSIVGYDRKVVKPLPWDRMRTMDQVIRDCAGETYAKTFWPRWLKNYFGEDDIKAMADMGLNSVRLVMNSAFFLKEEPGLQWIEETFSYVDQILNWCEKYRVYAILDLHAAPGGQSAITCDGGYDTRPRLFYEKESWDRGIALLREWAKRWCDRSIVAGYDFLNEPLSSPLDVNILPRLGQFYDEAIQAMREYDKKHIFFLEGAFFATDCSLYDHEFDPGYHNWAIHFHKYHFSPEKKELYPYFEKSLENDVPIWIGEGGADAVTNAVFYNIAADYGIGYSLWAWKQAVGSQMDTRRTVEHDLPKDWDKIVGYIRGDGDRPSYLESAKIFDEFLELVKFGNCTVYPTHIQTTMRRAPFVLPAVGYDNDSGMFGTWDFGNYFGYRAEDRTKLVFDYNLEHPVMKAHLRGRSTESNAAPLTALLLERTEGEYAVYTLRTAPEGTCVSVEATSETGAEFNVFWNGQLLGYVRVPASHYSMSVSDAFSISGEGIVRIEVTKGIVRLKNIRFTVG